MRPHEVTDPLLKAKKEEDKKTTLVADEEKKDEERYPFLPSAPVVELVRPLDADEAEDVDVIVMALKKRESGLFSGVGKW